MLFEFSLNFNLDIHLDDDDDDDDAAAGGGGGGDGGNDHAEKEVAQVDADCR